MTLNVKLWLGLNITDSGQHWKAYWRETPALQCVLFTCRVALHHAVSWNPILKPFLLFLHLIAWFCCLSCNTVIPIVQISFDIHIMHTCLQSHTASPMHVHMGNPAPALHAHKAENFCTHICTVHSHTAVSKVHALLSDPTPHLSVWEKAVGFVLSWVWRHADICCNQPWRQRTCCSGDPGLGLSCVQITQTRVPCALGKKLLLINAVCSGEAVDSRKAFSFQRRIKEN